jgi:hypothetical protein
MKRLIILIIILLIIYLIWDLNFHNRVAEPSITSVGKSKSFARDAGGRSLPNPEPTTTGQLQSLIESDNAPIAFYGLVVDEKGTPLSDVEVSWDILKSGSFAPSLGLPTGANGTVRTNSKGRFSVAETGSSLSIETLMKKGYRQGRQMQASYGYGSNAQPHRPDESKPECFLMVKDATRASVKVEIPLKFNWDGLPKEFEIGHKELSNKIILVPTREPSRTDIRDYNWKLIIKVENSQLILGKNGGAPLAPDTGYTDTIVLQNDIEGQRGSKADALLYLKTDSGIYAEFRFSAYSDRDEENSDTGYIDIRWNQDGGRTFE